MAHGRPTGVMKNFLDYLGNKLPCINKYDAGGYHSYLYTKDAKWHRYNCKDSPETGGGI